MRFRLAWGSLAISALLVCFTALMAQQSLSVDQLLSFVRSSIKLKQPDKEVAGYITKLKLSEKLDERTVEELQGEGAGPRTVAALNELATASESLPKPQPKAVKPPPPAIPPPPPEEQQEIISQTREYAANYSTKLPNFICTQVTRQYYDRTGTESWSTAATVMEHLTYFDQQEHYKVMMVNNSYVDLAHDSVGGATSAGDFGSMLRVTLARKAEAVIEFDHWATLRGKRCYVFSYSITSGNSDYSIRWEKDMRIIVGYHGLIYVDKDTHQVLRIALEADNIPPSFPVQEARETLDYDYVEISGQPFMLPLKAVVRMRHDKYLTKNEIEFRLYRKFSADAEIKFDTVTPDPLPEDKEQAPKP
jgi:hypothetical protein